MIILASQSPIRKTLLSAAGVNFKAEASPLDEAQAKMSFGNADPALLASHLADEKALAMSREKPKDMIVAADQTLACDGMILHKSNSLEEARQQLLFLCGKTHLVHSALAVAKQSQIQFRHISTARMTMRHFSETFLDRYLETVDPAVATSLGGYQLESIGVQLFDRIEGDYFTILGLPLLPLLAFLRKNAELYS